MLDVAVNTYKRNKLLPLYDAAKAQEHCVNLAPNTTFARGTVLGQITNSANDVQTITVSGTPTGGTFTLKLEYPVGNVQTTGAIAYNATASAVQTALAALPNVGSGNVSCSGGAFPGTAVVATFQGGLAGRPIPVMTLGTNSLSGGSSPTAGVAHTTTGRTAGTFKAYADGNSDGSQAAKAILPYDCTTDAAGMVSFSDTNGGVWGEKAFDVDVYYSGVFKTSELVGLDANGVTDLSGLIISGSVSDGVLSF